MVQLEAWCCQKEQDSLQNTGPNSGCEYVFSAHISLLFPARKPDQHFYDATYGQNGLDGSCPADMWTISVWNVSLWFVWSCANPQLLQQRFYYLFIAPFSPPCRTTGCAKSRCHSLRQQKDQWALRAGRRWGSNRDQDLAETMMYVLFAPPVQPFNTHHAPFNRPLLLSVLTTSLPWPPPPFYFFLKSLPVNYRLSFIFLPRPLPLPFPPYSVEVAGEESSLV